MNNPAWAAMLCAAVLSIIGCDEQNGAGAKAAEAADGSAKTGDAAAPPAKLEFKKLGELAIEAEVPSDASIEDESKKAGFPSVSIWGGTTIFVRGKNDLMWSKDVAGAKERLAKDPNKLQSYTKEEVKDDGSFHLEFTRESMMDKTPLYGVAIRKKVGDSYFDCGTNADSEAEQARVAAVCNSLRAAS